MTISLACRGSICRCNGFFDIPEIQPETQFVTPLCTMHLKFSHGHSIGPRNQYAIRAPNHTRAKPPSKVAAR